MAASWKKVIVSGSQAHLAAVTASTAVLVSTNQRIGTDLATTYLTGSLSGSLTGTFNGTFDGTAASASFVTSSNVQGPHGMNSVLSSSHAVQALSASYATTASYALNAGGGSLTVSGSAGGFVIELSTETLSIIGTANEIETNGNTDNTITIGLPDNVTIAQNLTVTGDVAVNGGDITTTGTTFNIANDNSVTAITMGGNATTTTMQNLTLNGNLSVLGTTTTVTSENLTVADRFILLASGSDQSNKDGGIIIQKDFTVGPSGRATGSGYAFFLDGDRTAPVGGTPRWAVTASVSELSNSANADEFMVTVKNLDAGDLTKPAVPTWGGAAVGGGNMVIDGAGDIWIWVQV